VPVTAKLSKKFYEVFGEEVTSELVNWFNAVDATYRADLRELNELNFARFDAKLEQRLAELDAKWLVRWTELASSIRERLAHDLGTLKSDLLKWMFGFWASVVVALAVLALRS
jgi:hypothetical protein